MTIRDVGDEGESYFKGLCSNVGITANPSTNDKHGWDYIAEFPIEASSSESMDRKSAPIECKVQVKSTEKRDKKLQVKVSVLYRLVKSQIPTFFCFFEFGRGPTPKNAYLLHVDSSLIDKVLRRVRSLEAKGEADNLHKHTLSIEYDDNHKFAHDSGYGLRHSIECHIPSGLDNYIKSKQAYLEKSGYTKESHRMNLTFSSNNEVEKLLDLEMGLIDSVSFEKIDTFSKRYNIELPDNQLSTTNGGRLSLSKNKSRQGVLFFKEAELSAPVEFIADVFLPHLMLTPNLNFRAKTSYFDLIVRQGKPEFTYTWKSAEMLAISELRNYAWVLDRLFSDKSLIIGLELDSRACNIFKVSFSVPKGNKNPYKDLFELVERTLFVCRKFVANTDKVLVDTNSLYANQNSIDKFYALLHDSPNSFNLSCKVKPGITDTFNLPPVATVFKLTTEIGSHSLAMIGAVLADSKNCVLNGDECSCTANKIEIYRQYVGSTEEVSSNNFDNDMEDFRLYLQSQGYELLKLNC